MVKIMQYGEGNFLRAFADLYFNTLNEEGLGEYSVDIIKPAPFGSLDKFEKQGNRYNVVLRGAVSGEVFEKAYPVSCVNRTIDPFLHHDEYIAIAKDPELKIIVSNTTEAGICFSGSDSMNGFEEITYPAKLTKFLFERFKAGLSGVYLMPVELIDNNADELKKCVDLYIGLWNLPKEFKEWNDSQNFYCNTLVDRIVSGYPRDEQTKNHLTEIIGYEDGLVTIGEPFGLWAVEKKGDIATYIKEGVHNVEVVLTEDIAYYKKRKVRVLNGSHTNLVPAGLIWGEKTVYDCMKNPALLSFVEKTLQDEINPFVSDDLAATTEFANSVTDRFLNPFLNHQLVSISLNSISKWRARNLPSFKDYYKKHGKIAPCLTVGFSYLMALYSSVKRDGDGFSVELKSGKITLQDTREYLEYFVENQPIDAFMANIDVWGEDLTLYKGFKDTVIENIEKIKKGISLI
ncbi:MAG: tagaturonate reductase [Clostridia bacterium]|nr:tagaturonate reductase [Clostridia bacterium]